MTWNSLLLISNIYILTMVGKKQTRKRKKKGGDMLTRLNFINSLVRKVGNRANREHTSHGRGQHSSDIKSLKKELVSFLKKFGKTGRRAKKLAMNSTGKHTLCLLAALANQERCLTKDIYHNNPDSASGSRGYTGKFETVGLEKSCSVESIQKILQDWDKNWKTSIHSTCGNDVYFKLLEVSSKKDREMAAKYESHEPQQIILGGKRRKTRRKKRRNKTKRKKRKTKKRRK